MTITAVNTTAEALNSLDQVATAIQKKAGQLEHLIAVCEETHHALNSDSSTAVGRTEAENRIGYLLDLAGSIAGEIVALGEQVEFATPA